jgi:hypothetical protein
VCVVDTRQSRRPATAAAARGAATRDDGLCFAEEKNDFVWRAYEAAHGAYGTGGVAANSFYLRPPEAAWRASFS